jgi:hypothetical protein
MKDLSLHILDIVQNSTRAGATLVYIDVVENDAKDLLSIQISDNGSGMTPEVLKNVTDPFYTTRTTRKVGLGIPLLVQNAERTGGSVTINSEVGKGTCVKAIFKLTHIDLPPWGDMGGTVALLASGHPNIDFKYCHIRNGLRFNFDTQQIKNELNTIPITHPEVIRFMTDMIKENLQEIGVDTLA